MRDRIRQHGAAASDGSPGPRAWAASESLVSRLPSRPGSARWAWVLGAAGLLGVALLYSSEEPKRPHGSRPPEVAVAGLAGREARGREAIRPEPLPELVIHATPEREEPPVQKASEVQGTLKLVTEPSVTVFAGERRLGRTPLALTLPAGRHELRLVDKRRHLEVRRAIDVRPGQVREREWSFGVGRLRLSAPAGSKLYLNQRYVGRAPLAPLELAEGRHRLRLILPQGKVEEWIDVPAARTVDYRVRD